MSEPSPESGGPESAIHRPVLVREVLKFLELEPGLTVVDGTVGAGGHSRKILEAIGPTGTLIGLDRDPMMLKFAASALPEPNCFLRHASYTQLPDILHELNRPCVDRILLDLGLSSDQLADEARGFGFQSAGKLDLRFDTTTGKPAWKLLERVNEEELEQILSEFGEERFSGAIARQIVETRRTKPIRTARDLVAATIAAIPAKYRREAKKQPATRVFQALRIAVNKELNHLDRALHESLHPSLTPEGRMVVISFHSLEDRLVKQEFREKNRWQNLTPKPVTATPAEIRINPRSRTAKLRAARRK